MTDIEYRNNKRSQLYHELLRRAQEHVDFTDRTSVDAYNEYAAQIRRELMEGVMQDRSE